MRAARTTAVECCLHCASPFVAPVRGAFCCRGCAEVHRLIVGAGLDRYYALGGGAGHPVVRAESDRKWVEPIAQRLANAPALTRVDLDVQGVHCAACVWLLEQLFRKRDGAGIVVNPGVGSVELTVAPSFDLDGWVSEVETFGYRLGPALKQKSPSDLVWRMGVCVAIAMNTMIFGFAIYCGLPPGRVYHLFHALDFALSFVSVLVGGTVFLRSAWRALRRGLLHLDLPIALGILLVFASSTYTYATRGGATSYFDTLNVFIALMLVGRFLQERVLSKNRAMLLADGGAEGLYTRRIDVGGRVVLTRCTEICAGDELLVGHKDLVPVDATLLGQGRAAFSLDWISGESTPRTIASGETIPAGAFCQDVRSVTVRALSAFDASSVASLLRTASRRASDVARATPWFTRLTRLYVAVVLTVSLAAFIGWFAATRDLARTLDVVAGVLIVTCPCAFGIATPLAYEIVQARLRRVGLFVRTPGFLDRAAEVTRLVFDKTGTLTTGALVLSDARPIAALPAEDRATLHTLAVRSSHPKSRSIATAIERMGPAPVFDASLAACEVVGKGMELRRGGRVYRFGAPAWAVANAEIAAIVPSADVVFSEDGVVRAALRTREELRPDAASEVRALRQDGYDVFVLSGDRSSATVAIAEACGIVAARAFGARSPKGKADWLREHGAAKTLFVGDGINDSLAAESASCAGTPAIDRPFMASRSDFYFVTPGLRPIREALQAAKRLSRVVRANLVTALAYNAVTVSLALAGLMTPLVCAVLMPLSSLSTVLVTTALLRRRSSWTS